MNPFVPHGNWVLQSPMHALAAEQSDAEAEERAGLRPWRMGTVGCMAEGATSTRSAHLCRTIATATITVRGLGSMDMTVAGIADGNIAMVIAT